LKDAGNGPRRILSGRVKVRSENPEDPDLHLRGQDKTANEGRANTPLPAGNGPAILVVSQDLVVRDLLLEIAIEHGFGVYCASGCEDATRVLQLEPPGMVVADLDTHEGRSFLRSLRASEPGKAIPLVALTGTNNPMVAVSVDAPVFFKPEVTGLERALVDCFAAPRSTADARGLAGAAQRWTGTKPSA